MTKAYIDGFNKTAEDFGVSGTFLFKFAQLGALARGSGLAKTLAKAVGKAAKGAGKASKAVAKKAPKKVTVTTSWRGRSPSWGGPSKVTREMTADQAEAFFGRKSGTRITGYNNYIDGDGPRNLYPSGLDLTELFSRAKHMYGRH